MVLGLLIVFLSPFPVCISVPCSSCETRTGELLDLLLDNKTTSQTSDRKRTVGVAQKGTWTESKMKQKLEKGKWIMLIVLSV